MAPARRKMKKQIPKSWQLRLICKRDAKLRGKGCRAAAAGGVNREGKPQKGGLLGHENGVAGKGE